MRGRCISKLVPNDVLQKVIRRSDVVGLDERLMRLIMGSKNGVSIVAAVNVMMFIEAVDETVPNFKKAYESLCE
jgi:hypothetical protein